MEQKIVNLQWIKRNSPYSGDYWIGMLPKCKQPIVQVLMPDDENNDLRYQIFGMVDGDRNFLGFCGNQGYKKFGYFNTLQEAQDKCQEIFEQQVKENFFQ